jgi:hypothetical protein
MTALSDYQRLETTGVWRSSPDAQRRDVVVAIGEATLVMTDHTDTALSHWSLAALERRNPGTTPAVYAPGEDAAEELEIADAEMIAAIERVRRAVERSRPRPGRLRSRIALGLVVAIAVVGLLWVPDAVIRQAARVAPEAARAEIGAAVLANVGRISGAPCVSPAGEQALARLKTRILGAEAQKLVVVRDALPAAAHLPGGIVLLSRELVEDYETPEVAAGYLLAEKIAASQTDPLLRLLDWAGTGAAFGLLTRGEVPEEDLRDYAEYLLGAEGARVPDPALLSAFAEAGVRAAPYAYARDVTGEATVALIEADPVPPGEARTILSDGDWVALQGICGG